MMGITKFIRSMAPWVGRQRLSALTRFEFSPRQLAPYWVAAALACLAIIACRNVELGTGTAVVEGPYKHRGGHMYVTLAPVHDGIFRAIPSNSQAGRRSTLRVFENGHEIGPPNSAGTDIRALGGGRYNHWINKVLLSTPAGDPPAEHANFTATYTLSLDPVIVHWAGVVLLGLVAGMFALLTANLVQEQASAAAMRGRGDLAWIAVSSLGLLATGAAFFYVDDVSEQYFRITQVAQNAYFPAAEYDEAFDSPPKLVDTPRRNGMPGVAEPWWTTQLSSGNTLILRDRVDRLERKLKKVHGQFFIDVFGRELDADEPGWLVQRAEKAHIRPTHGPRWHRIPIAAKEDLLPGEFEITYQSAVPSARFELWGVLQGVRYRPLSHEPPLLRVDEQIQPLQGLRPAPARGGGVNLRELKILANLDRSPGVDVLWRTGVEHAFTLSTKRFGLLLFIGGSVLAVVSVCQALRASFGPISKWRDWAFPAACFLAAAGIHWSADNAADKNLNGYVSSLEAREYLAAAPARQAEFLADRFGATGWRFERRPETMPNVMSEPLVPARALGNYGVHSDASGYFYIGWRILNNDRLKYFAPPVGLPILVAVVAKLTGLSAETVADVQTLMYLIVGLLLAIAVKNWSRSTVMAGVTLLCWAWLEEAARFAKYMMTESFGVFVVALFLAICSFATRETRNEPRQQDLPVLIALAFVLMFAIYVRDVFIVIGWLSLAVFLGLWRRPVRYRLKAGGFIAILFVASWLFVPLLHADRGLEAGPLSLTPISFIRVSSFEKNAKWAAGENAEPVGGPPLMQGLAFHAHSALEDPTEFVAYQIAQVGKFWGADNFTWIGQSGLPYLDHPLDQYGRHVYRLVVFVAVAGGLLSVLVLAFVRRSCELKQLAWVMALLFAFLIVATAFHTLMFVWFGPRARVSFYPFVMISAGLTPVLMARLVQALVWVKVPAGSTQGAVHETSTRSPRSLQRRRSS